MRQLGHRKKQPFRLTAFETHITQGHLLSALTGKGFDMSDHFFRKPIRIGNHVFTGMTPVRDWPKHRDNVAVKFGYMLFDQYGRAWSKYDLAALRSLSWNWN